MDSVLIQVSQKFYVQQRNLWGDFTEYIPLVPGGHQKSWLFFINVFPKMTKCYKRYMEKVTRKHTRQAPRQIIGPSGLWSPPGLSTRDTQFFFSSFFCFKTAQNSTKRGTMFCTTLKLKEVLNKQILSASVPDAAVLIWNSQSLE